MFDPSSPFAKSCEGIRRPGIERETPIEEDISPYGGVTFYRESKIHSCSQCKFSWKVGRAICDVAFRCSHSRKPVGNRFMLGTQGCSLHQAT
jgi:predicted  nucleic acid-binding Zn ribbon protein